MKELRSAQPSLLNDIQQGNSGRYLPIWVASRLMLIDVERKIELIQWYPYTDSVLVIYDSPDAEGKRHNLIMNDTQDVNAASADGQNLSQGTEWEEAEDQRQLVTLALARINNTDSGEGAANAKEGNLMRI
jgi:hypothetical protein